MRYMDVLLNSAAQARGPKGHRCSLWALAPPKKPKCRCPINYAKVRVPYTAPSGGSCSYCILSITATFVCLLRLCLVRLIVVILLMAVVIILSLSGSSCSCYTSILLLLPLLEALHLYIGNNTQQITYSYEWWRPA